jgi:hypothetical protein
MSIECLTSKVGLTVGDSQLKLPVPELLGNSEPLHVLPE